MKVSKYLKRGIIFLRNGIPTNNITAEIVSLSPSDLLNGRTALITGGTSGIGKAIAKAFLKAGANVIITGRDLQRTVNMAEEISGEVKKGSIYAIDINNLNVASFEAKFSEILNLIGDSQIDILVNNAGINGGPFFEGSEDEYDMVLDTNLKGTFFLSRIVSSYMIDNHINGNILNVTSSSSIRPANNAYAISKWGINGLTLGMAKMLIKHNIVVNGIAPGPTATPMLTKEGNNSISLPQNPSGRYAMPEEIANLAVILVSSMGRMVVGDVLYVTGGAGVITYDDVNY